MQASSVPASVGCSAWADNFLASRNPKHYQSLVLQAAGHLLDVMPAMRYFSPVILIAALLLQGCGRTVPEPAEQAAPGVDAQGRITLSPAQVQSLGITTVAAQAAASVPLMGLPALIAAPLSASTELILPYASVVTKVLVDEGQVVARGQAMLRVQSRAAAAAQADLARAHAAAELAQQQAQRDALLLQEGLIAKARQQESSARAAAAQVDVALAHAQMAQLRPLPGGLPGEFELLAAQAGRVLHRTVKPGQALDALASAFTLLEGEILDVEFNVPLRLQNLVKPGLLVQLQDGSQARVMAVGGDADPGTQGLRVRAQIEGASTLLPGQQLEVTLHLAAPSDALQVPAAALMPHGEQHVLYVREGSAWHGVKVTLLGGDGRLAVVQGKGLQAGAQVAATGGNLLKTLAPLE